VSDWNMLNGIDTCKIVGLHSGIAEVSKVLICHAVSMYKLLPPFERPFDL